MAKEKKSKKPDTKFDLVFAAQHRDGEREITFDIGGKSRTFTFKTRQQRLVTQKLQKMGVAPLQAVLGVWLKNLPTLQNLLENDVDGFLETLHASLDVNMLSVLLFAGHVGNCDDQSFGEQVVDDWIDNVIDEQGVFGAACLYAAVMFTNVGSIKPPPKNTKEEHDSEGEEQNPSQ